METWHDSAIPRLPETKGPFWLPPGWRDYRDPPDPQGLTRAILAFDEELYERPPDAYAMRRAWEIAVLLTETPHEEPDPEPPHGQHIPPSLR